jgi:predicted nuclease with TOPRIM domain
VIYLQQTQKQQRIAITTKEWYKMTLTNEDLQAIATLMDNKLQPINDRLDKIESEVSALKAGQRELKKEVRELKDKVNDTYDLALDAWGQSTENRYWLEKKVEMP